MQPSNIKKYTIDDFELPCAPTKVHWEDQLISRSWRNGITGDFVGKPINLSGKIIWIWDLISQENLNTIVSKIKTKITSTKSMYYDINSYTPYGWIKATCYLPGTIQYQAVYGRNNEVLYWTCEIHWTVAKGIQLK